jgi:hypothetical protein
VLCPPELFYNIIHVNCLRSKAVKLANFEDNTSQVEDAYRLLADIQAFSPSVWAEARYFDDWVLVGTIYQSAVALYCIMAMQSLKIFPYSVEMEAMRTVLGDCLLTGLKMGIKSPKVRNFILWPTVVAGVEAANRDEQDRDCIRKSLLVISRGIGSYGPLKARVALDEFWARSCYGWDECFDRPYMFVI